MRRTGCARSLDRFTRETGASVAVAAVTGDDLPEKLKVEVRAGRPTIDLFAKDTLALRVLVDEALVEDLSDVEIPEGVLPGWSPSGSTESSTSCRSGLTSRSRT